MVCALLKDENGYFCENELRMFRMVEKQSGRLRGEAARTLREYVLQVRELFQAEIDIRQNRIMKTLAIVTTIFLPLSLVLAGDLLKTALACALCRLLLAPDLGRLAGEGDAWL